MQPTDATDVDRKDVFEYKETAVEVVEEDAVDLPKAPLEQLQSTDSQPMAQFPNQLNELEGLEVDFPMEDPSQDYGGDDIINPMEDAAYYQGSFVVDNNEQFQRQFLDESQHEQLQAVEPSPVVDDNKEEEVQETKTHQVAGNQEINTDIIINEVPVEVEVSDGEDLTGNNAAQDAADKDTTNNQVP